jgi:hypothetical protein
VLDPCLHAFETMAKKTISRNLAPAPGSKDHFTLKSQYDLFIGGKWTALFTFLLLRRC